jgi:hypothetical protein
MVEIEREIGSVGEAQLPPARLTKLLQQAVAHQVSVRLLSRMLRPVECGREGEQAGGRECGRVRRGQEERQGVQEGGPRDTGRRVRHGRVASRATCRVARLHAVRRVARCTVCAIRAPCCAAQVESSRYRPKSVPSVKTLLEDYSCFAIPNSTRYEMRAHTANIKCFLPPHPTTSLPFTKMRAAPGRALRAGSGPVLICVRRRCAPAITCVSIRASAGVSCLWARRG